MFTRPFSRGSSVLAALMLVGALGAVMFLMQVFNSPQDSQSQTAAGALATLTPPGVSLPPGASATEQACTLGYDYKVDEAPSGKPQVNALPICPTGENAKQQEIKGPTRVTSAISQAASAVFALGDAGTWNQPNDSARCEPDPNKQGKYKPKADYKCLTRYCVSIGGGDSKCMEADKPFSPGAPINPQDIQNQLRTPLITDLLQN
jgi:hypothetical protein